MAKFRYELSEELSMKLSRLKDKQDVMAEKMLDAGGELLLEQVKASLSGVIGKDLKGDPNKPPRTGELVRGLGKTPVKPDRYGNYDIRIGYAPDATQNGVPLAKIANILEYGKKGQKAKPFMKPAAKKSKKAVVAEMERVFEEEMK